MNNLNQYLNWLTITTSGLCATLLLVTGAQAADSITTTPKSATATVSQFSPNPLIAVRKKQPRLPRPMKVTYLGLMVQRLVVSGLTHLNMNLHLRHKPKW